MKQLLGTRDLWNRLTQAYESAQIFQELDQKNFDDFAKLWKPLLDKRRAEFPSWAAAAAGDAQDSHWEWMDKALAARRSMVQDTFAIECGAETQGLMLIEAPRFGKLKEHQGREIVYVELAATAPWNRKKLVPDAKYKGVGTMLFATAISYSHDLGSKRRLGLHSLPQPESWYRDVAGFSDLGFDAAKRMQYFEVTEDQAAAFLGKSGGT
jgi:hypothetical protein